MHCIHIGIYQYAVTFKHVTVLNLENQNINK